MESLYGLFMEALKIVEIFNKMNSWRQQPQSQQSQVKVELPAEGEPLTPEQFRQKHKIYVKNLEPIPDPYETFEGHNLPPYITDVTKSLGFKALTPVQAQALPIIITGRDFIGISKTGSGKTLAFLIPGICKIVAEKPKGRGPNILVLSPTRELAMQIENQFKKFLFKSEFNWACVYGGIKKDFQRHHLRKDIQILVATPGRLIDFLMEQSINLENVCYFVLDEADMMLDMGFSPQIRQICGHLKKPRQNLMFSATWPFAIRELAARYLENAVCLTIGEQDRTVNDSISQQIKIVRHREKIQHLERDLRITEERRLVFVQRKIDCENLSELLFNKAGIYSCTIHGDKAQIQRDKALQQFKSGKTKVMIATDVASRGLDIPDVQLVINYDFPKQIEDYIHRIGRTGRAGKKGATISYVVEGEDNRVTEQLVPLLRSAKQNVAQELVDFSRRKGNDKGDKFSKRYNYNYNPTQGSSNSLADSWRSTKQPNIEPRSMKNFDENPPLRRFQSDRGNFKSQKFIAKSSKFIQSSKIYHPSIKFTINDTLLEICFMDLNTLDVDTLVVPYLESDKDNKSTKKLAKYLGLNIQELAKELPIGQLKEIKNKKLEIDSIVLFTHVQDHDPDGSYLVYILDKILKFKQKTCSKLGIFQVGVSKYPLEIQCKMVLYSLFQVLEKSEHERLKEIKIYCEDPKEFMKYAEVMSEVMVGIPTQNLILEN